MLTLALAQAGVLALLTAGPSLPPPPASLQGALDDPTIVAIFDAANTYDMETSGLAAKRATHADVRALATQFAGDHKAVRQQGRDLAKKLGVTPTPPKDDKSAQDHAAAMKKLESAKGEEFDKVYLAHEVAYHQAVVDAINKTLLPAIKNAELKAFVQKVGPAFQAHLDAAKKLAQKYGATS
jgi:putative membrane protein